MGRKRAVLKPIDQFWLECLGSRVRSSQREQREFVLVLLRRGGSIRVVAEAAGLSPTTVQKWKREDADAGQEP